MPTSYGCLPEALGESAETLGESAETLGESAETLGESAETLGTNHHDGGTIAEPLLSFAETLRVFDKVNDRRRHLLSTNSERNSSRLCRLVDVAVRRVVS